MHGCDHVYLTLKSHIVLTHTEVFHTRFHFILLFNPLIRIRQKTGSHFVKTHGLYKNRPSHRNTI